MADKLSEMMRYTMKDTQQDFVLLEDEINYINNFIELQKLRLDTSRLFMLTHHTRYPTNFLLTTAYVTACSTDSVSKS